MTWQQFWCWIGWHDFGNHYYTIITIDKLRRVDKCYSTCLACKKKFQMSTEYIGVAEREIPNDVDGKS